MSNAEITKRIFFTGHYKQMINEQLEERTIYNVQLEPVFKKIYSFRYNNKNHNTPTSDR